MKDARFVMIDPNNGVVVLIHGQNSFWQPRDHKGPVQMSPEAHTTNSVATLPKALSSAPAAADASAAVVGTVARKIRASTICPLSPRILAENSTSACGAAASESWKLRMSMRS